MKRDSTYLDIERHLDRDLNDKGLYNLVGVDQCVVTRVRDELMLEESGVTRMCMQVDQGIVTQGTTIR